MAPPARGRIHKLQPDQVESAGASTSSGTDEDVIDRICMKFLVILGRIQFNVILYTMLKIMTPID
jgi:hypothetical protein